MALKRLGDILVNSGIITKTDLAQAIEMQNKNGKRLGQILVEMGLVTENKLIEILEFQLGIPHINLKLFYVDQNVVHLIPEDMAKKNICIAFKKDKKNIFVAMYDPMDIIAIDDIKLITKLNVVPYIATLSDINEAIKKYYQKQEAEKAVNEFDDEYEPQKEAEAAESDDISNAPAVRLVNSIIEQAVRARASDIHIEPSSDDVRIRFRIDGELIENMRVQKITHGPIITRIKIISNLDIAEKRLPQDGRVEMNIDGRDMDLRISILPTIHGEKAVIRLLDRGNFLVTKSDLGMVDSELKIYDDLVRHPHGIILITGPTGSGKTTTLYTMLKELNTPDKNIITVEDPVEYTLEGVNQVQVNEKAGLTFARALRSILRQDPNIIMVGEIRDTETAEIAIRSAITGHLVLSTLHTNDAPGTVARLIDMGVEPYLVSSSVVGIIAQRLVRKICSYCKYPYDADDSEKKLLGVDVSEKLTLYRGRGCALCGKTGYKGRLAVFEMMAVSKSLRNLISRGASSDDLREAALKDGMIPLNESAKIKVLDGTTTINEMLRITYTEE